MDNKKMRVWWIPQVGVEGGIFYVPVNSVEQAMAVMDILAAYDCFQYNKNIKPDYCNVGGLEVWDEEEHDWIGWDYESETEYFDDIGEYIENKSPMCDKLKQFQKDLLVQVHFD